MTTVQSIDRAFGVLRALAAGPAGVTDIADRVGLPKSTVSRMLSTLEELGAVEQVSVGGEYRIGFSRVDYQAAPAIFTKNPDVVVLKCGNTDKIHKLPLMRSGRLR